MRVKLRRHIRSDPQSRPLPLVYLYFRIDEEHMDTINNILFLGGSIKCYTIYWYCFFYKKVLRFPMQSLPDLSINLEDKQRKNKQTNFEVCIRTLGVQCFVLINLKSCQFNAFLRKSNSRTRTSKVRQVYIYFCRNSYRCMF